jgi:hypothetical protein
MDINEYTVCAENGQVDGEEGTIVKGGNDYTFYIRLEDPEQITGEGEEAGVPYDADAARTAYEKFSASGYGKYEKTTDGKTEYFKVALTEVKLAMPLGGPVEGLFRFPRVGERVLAGCLGNTVINAGQDGSPVISPPDGPYVLMGYMPCKTQWFYPDKAGANADDTDASVQTRGFSAPQKNPGSMGDFLQDKGMALRYKRDGAGTGTGDFSEIGFYNKKAKWPKTEGGTDYPGQDTLNIQSTGDIESRTENYHLLKAGRFEILAGDKVKEISPGRRIDNANSRDWKAGDAPLGDHPMDDPALHNGDLHIRAGKNVVIKAEGEIRLQVGRTTLVINDKGFSAVTRKVNSNVPTTFDTSLNLDSRTGISMFGQTVGVGAGHSFSLSEGLGGAVSSTAGVLSLGGREIKAASANVASQIFSCIMYPLELAFNLGAAGAVAAGGDKNSQRAAFIAEKVWQTVKVLGNAFYTLYDNVNESGRNSVQKTYEAMNKDTGTGAGTERPSGNAAADNTTDAVSKAAGMIGLEPLECLSSLLGVVLNISSSVYAALDSCTVKTDKELRNNLNVIAMAVDNGILEAFAVAISAAASSPAPAVLRLRANGDAVIKAAADKSFYALEAKKGAATATLVPPALMRGIKITAGVAALGPSIAAAVTQIQSGEKNVTDLKTEGL